MSGDVLNSNGIRVAVVRGPDVFDLTGKKLYLLKGANIYRLSGELVGKRADKSTVNSLPRPAKAKEKPAELSKLA